MNLKEEKDYQLRQYKRLLKDLQQIIKTMLEGIDDPGFEPSTAIETHLLRATALAGALRVLNGVEESDRPAIIADDHDWVGEDCKEVASTLGDRIKAIRESKKLSQQEFADLLGLTQAAVSQYERGDRLLSFEALAKLATHKFNIGWLLTGRSDRHE